MRFYRKKFILALICLAAAAALTWKLFDAVEGAKQTVTLVQVTRRVEKGTRMTGEILGAVEVGSFGLDGRALVSDESVIGKYAACDIYPGDILTPEKFRDFSEIADNYVYKTRETGKSAVSVQLKSVSAGMSGKLIAGDVVSAYVFVGEGGVGSNKGSVATYPELEFLEVAAVTNSRAEDIRYEPDREADGEKGKASGDSSIPATVVFIADAEQALRLVEAENAGAIHLVFRGRGEYAQQLLTEYEAAEAERKTAAAAQTGVAEGTEGTEGAGVTQLASPPGEARETPVDTAQAYGEARSDETPGVAPDEAHEASLGTAASEIAHMGPLDTTGPSEAREASGDAASSDGSARFDEPTGEAPGDTRETPVDAASADGAARSDETTGEAPGEARETPVDMAPADGAARSDEPTDEGISSIADIENNFYLD